MEPLAPLIPTTIFKISPRAKFLFRIQNKRKETALPQAKVIAIIHSTNISKHLAECAARPHQAPRFAAGPLE